MERNNERPPQTKAPVIKRSNEIHLGPPKQTGGTGYYRGSPRPSTPISQQHQSTTFSTVRPSAIQGPSTGSHMTPVRMPSNTGAMDLTRSAPQAGEGASSSVRHPSGPRLLSSNPTSRYQESQQKRFSEQSSSSATITSSTTFAINRTGTSVITSASSSTQNQGASRTAESTSGSRTFETGNSAISAVPPSKLTKENVASTVSVAASVLPNFKASVGLSSLLTYSSSSAEEDNVQDDPEDSLSSRPGKPSDGEDTTDLKLDGKVSENFEECESVKPEIKNAVAVENKPTVVREVQNKQSDSGKVSIDKGNNENLGHTEGKASSTENIPANRTVAEKQESEHSQLVVPSEVVSKEISEKPDTKENPAIENEWKKAQPVSHASDKIEMDDHLPPGDCSDDHADKLLVSGVTSVISCHKASKQPPTEAEVISSHQKNDISSPPADTSPQAYGQSPSDMVLQKQEDKQLTSKETLDSMNDLQPLSDTMCDQEKNKQVSSDVQASLINDESDKVKQSSVCEQELPLVDADSKVDLDSCPQTTSSSSTSDSEQSSQNIADEKASFIPEAENAKEDKTVNAASAVTEGNVSKHPEPTKATEVNENAENISVFSTKVSEEMEYLEDIKDRVKREVEKSSAWTTSLSESSVDASKQESAKGVIVDVTVDKMKPDEGRGKKRTKSTDATGDLKENVEVPLEKKCRMMEQIQPSPTDTDSSLQQELGNEKHSDTPEEMEVEPKQEEEKSSQELSDKNEKMDEDSRDDIIDNSKDGNQDKIKDEEEEVQTPSRKKKKRKAYERPRGEGGKFKKEKPNAALLDEETRMESSLLLDEDSQGSVSKREVRRFRCEVIVPESTEVFTADKVVEYVWPLENGEHYFIQEQISQYLGIMSFKRRYPDLRRRPLEMQERDYLKDKGLVSEMACDLGLTAVRSEDVLDVMFSDFPSKFEELQRLLRERQEGEIRERGKVNYSMANIDKSKMQEYGRKAAEDAARWNAAFNKEKREERRYSFDLQTFTLQMPLGRGKKLQPEQTKLGGYPVAVLPGQYSDYYREYTTQALSSLPISTIMAAPVVPDTLGSDGAASDSEEEASIAASGAESTKEVKEEDTEGLPRCKVCNGTKNRNKAGKPEPLIICGSCRSASHPTCIDLTLVMVPKIESYNWQCMDCKSCVTCNDPDDEDKMIFCDMCDRGYHIYCVGLRRVPNGRWHCKECAMCSSCGAKTPAGNEGIKNAEWQHEFKKDKDNKQLRYATTLCVPCDKYWKRRQFCYVCLRVYRSIPEDGMVRCNNCPKYIHREGCSTMYENERFCNNCYKMRNSTALNHSRIIAAAKKKMASGY